MTFFQGKKMRIKGKEKQKKHLTFLRKIVNKKMKKRKVAVSKKERRYHFLYFQFPKKFLNILYQLMESEV